MSLQPGDPAIGVPGSTLLLTRQVVEQAGAEAVETKVRAEGGYRISKGVANSQGYPIKDGWHSSVGGSAVGVGSATRRPALAIEKPIKKINSIEHLVQIEGSLRESLDQVQTHKENIEKQQLTPLECYSQMGCIYPLEWVLTSSFNPYHGLLIMTVNKWFYPRNQTGFPKGRGLPCRFLLWKLFWPAERMNQQENHVDYHAGGSFEAPQPAYDTPNVVGLPHLVLVLLQYLIGV
ncbi:hypothetical protein VitviT2T_000980 [Vitis vinifera]|uniref:Uncharacterized protein n=1 Tax=Vitis vinifera TaxID=29760 RepID=A0ABY9BEZ2_VITVI|nr:hypothetical protein VitviT2T_000980 [Vitis vinifera]